MSRRKSNRRKRKQRNLSEPLIESSIFFQVEEDILERTTRDVPLPSRRVLILCEGETEVSYFEGIKTNPLLRVKLQAVDIQILRPNDNSLKGLVWKAMQLKKQADNEDNSYDEIWISVDNDDRNSYLLNQRSLKRIQSKFPDIDVDQIQLNLGKAFLCEGDYLEFLSSFLDIEPKQIEEIISLTEKARHWESFCAEDPGEMFFKEGGFDYGVSWDQKNRPKEDDFDPSWKNYIDLAYACRSIELWLIQHFGYCDIPFSTSDDAINHLHIFAPNYEKGSGNRKENRLNAYDILKPSISNKKFETVEEAETVLNRIQIAIQNSYLLAQVKEIEMAERGLQFFEINPFTTVQLLAAKLIDKEDHITWAKFGNSVSWNGLRILVEHDSGDNKVEFHIVNEKRSSLLINSQNFQSYFGVQQITDEGKISIISPISFEGGPLLLRQGEEGAGTVWFRSSYDTFLLKIQISGEDDFLLIH
ncbi:MAG: RloB domain-containing protein [Bacteroidetes bacterium]|nr:MAG: RloB domain-containing protein [Bacteroidota bacterium]